MKKLFLVGLCFSMSMAVNSVVFAQNMSEAEIKTMVEQRNTVDKVYTVGEITYNDAVYEGNDSLSKAPKVTESAAFMVTEDGITGYPEESAEGYVTVKDGNKNVEHYTRAEIHRDGSYYAKSSNLYGYGKVYAKTNYFFVYDDSVSSKAKVYYGGF